MKPEAISLKSADTSSSRWKLHPNGGITWDLFNRQGLPHRDRVEMDGRRIAFIPHYSLTWWRGLEVNREIIWTSLRRRSKESLRCFVTRTYGAGYDPIYIIDDALWPTPVVKRAHFDGALRFDYEPDSAGLSLQRILYPALGIGAAYDEFLLTNHGNEPRKVRICASSGSEQVEGDRCAFIVQHEPLESLEEEILLPGASRHLRLVFHARSALDTSPAKLSDDQLRPRMVRKTALDQTLVLDTPSPEINALFELCKFRACETLFETKMGLLHSPAGGVFYGGIWANDQCEYANPLFPFIGDVDALHAARICYRRFAEAAASDHQPLPSSFEAEGEIAMRAFKDRGDAAMIAHGLTRFLLASGDSAFARELWPFVCWCLDYCRGRTNEAGLVESDTDQMEGRLSIGKANLATSCLAYAGYLSAADLAEELAKPKEAEHYRNAAKQLHGAIEQGFGATVEGFETYLFAQGADELRDFACLPLCFGLNERSDSTLAALFTTPMWTSQGLKVASSENSCWDRGTLYALRGAFLAGDGDFALRFLTEYTQRRLLGDRVPYPVESTGENDMAHLSAECALYCRVLTEGLFGILPVGFRRFKMKPNLPEAWPQAKLSNIRAFGSDFSLKIVRIAESRVSVEVTTPTGWSAHFSYSTGDEPLVIDLPAG